MKITELLEKSEISIAYTTYKLICRNKVKNEGEEDKETELLGQTNLTKETIQLKNRAPNGMLVTLLHEIIHIIDAEHLLLPRKDHEESIDCLAKAFSDFLINNGIIEDN